MQMPSSSIVKLFAWVWPSVLVLMGAALCSSVAEAGSTTTSLVSSPNPSSYGQSVSLSATVTKLGGSFDATANADKISVGFDHACGVKTSGKVECWGSNASGQLGNGVKTNSSTPVTVSGISSAVSVGAGYAHSCAVISGGAVKCWGNNFNGQLGNGTNTDSSTPVTVSGITTATRVSTSAGGFHSCAVLSNGTVKCWGYNLYGQLGNGTKTDSNVPVLVSGITTAMSVSAGTDHTCALLTGGAVKCWGNNGNGQLGNGTTTGSSSPVSTTGISTAVVVVAGTQYSCASLTDGGVKCWGWNNNFSLGSGTSSDSSVPVSVYGISTAVSVAISGQGFHSCAILSDGTIKCWGLNSDGQLGNGTSGGTSMIPVTVSGISAARSVAAGGLYTCTVTSDGTALCWGKNDVGQLGISNFTSKSLPAPVIDPLIGTVDYYDGATLLGSAALSSGSASLSTSAIAGGTRSLTAAYSGSFPSSTSDAVSHVVNPVVQSITWIQSVTGNVGTSLVLTATASSGLAVTYTGTPGVCTISGSTLTFISVDTCTVTASQAGNNNYYPATDDSRSFIVGRGTQSISWTQSLSGNAGSVTSLTATASSGLAITYSGTAGVCTVSGSTLSLVGVGTCAVTASQAGDINYYAATPISKSFTVGKGTQTISWTQTLSGAVGNTITLSATGGPSTSSLTYAGTAGVCTVSGNVLSLGAIGSCTVTASQAGDTNFYAASPVTKTFTVGKGTQTIVFTSTAPSAVVDGTTYVPTATGGGSGNVVTLTIDAASSAVCSFSGGAIGFHAAGSCVIDANQAGNTNYNPATQVQQTISVGKGAQAITFTSTPPSVFVGGTAYAPTATGGATGNTVVFSIDAGSSYICSISEGLVSFNASGTCIINANQAGNDNYNSASQVQQSVTVGKGSQVITWTQSLAGNVGDTIGLSAPAGASGNPVTFASSTLLKCSVSNGQLSLLAGGTCTVKASLAGNADYLPAAAVEKSFSVIGPQLSLSRSTVAFGTWPLDTVSSAAPIRVSNTGPGILTIGGITLSGSDAAAFSQTSDCTSLSPGDYCSIWISFKPTTSGAKSATIAISSNATESPVSLSLSGTGGDAVGIIDIATSELSFGKQVVGSPAPSKRLVVANPGSATLTIGSILLSGTNVSSFSYAGACANIPAKTTCTLNISFVPSAVGSFNATLTINSNAYMASSVDIDLSGEGVETAVLQFVGNIDGPGMANGSGSDARFWGPSGIAVDSLGTLYVTDRNNQMVRKILPNRDVASLAGMPLVTGTANKKGVAAQFNMPSGISIFGNSLYVADAANNLIRKVTTTGVVSAVAGSPTLAGSVDGKGKTAKFSSPMGVTNDSLGNIYVTDTRNGTVRKITPKGIVTTFAGYAGNHGGVDGPGPSASFETPVGISNDAGNTLVVTDTTANTIRRISPTGDVTTFAGSYGVAGSSDDTGTRATFSSPYSAAVDTGGNTFVSDFSNATIRRINPAGVVSTFAGAAGERGSDDGTGTAARFQSPVAIAKDGWNNLYVADFYDNTIRKITPSGDVSLFAGKRSIFGSDDAAGSNAKFWAPSAVVVDGSGNLIVADTGNDTIRVISSDGVSSTLAGTPLEPGSDDGVGASARFNAPGGVAIASDGTVYVADTENHTIRQIATDGTVSTIAGLAENAGSSDGIGAAARFRSPTALALSPSGVLYVADSGNFTIRKIVLSSRQVTTLVGVAGVKGMKNGIGSAALFGPVYGLTLDSLGNIFATDYSSNTIRKITPAGVVTTFAGKANKRGNTNHKRSTSALFSSPYGITIDGLNNLYVSDYANCQIRKITSLGEVTTIAGRPGVCRFVEGKSPSTINAASGLAFYNSSIFFTAGNGVGEIANVP